MGAVALQPVGDAPLLPHITPAEASAAGCELLELDITWHDMIARYAEFRRRGARRGKQNPFPTADIVRTLVSRHGDPPGRYMGQWPRTPIEADRDDEAHPAREDWVIPSAALGLPIEGAQLAPAKHVRKRRERRPEVDLGRFSIRPADERLLGMASPLLLRVCSTDDSSLRCAALMLPLRFCEEALDARLRVGFTAASDRTLPQKERKPKTWAGDEVWIDAPSGGLRAWKREDKGLVRRMRPLNGDSSPPPADVLEAVMAWMRGSSVKG